MRHLVCSLVAAACGLLAGQARADNVSFPGFEHGSETVTIKLTGPNVGVNETVSAGGFITILNGGPSFESYCVDVYQTINFGAPAYSDYTPVGGTHLFANSNAYTDLSRLYARAGVVANAVEEAAFQIAVWEIAYETTGTYDLTSGSASFSGGAGDSTLALNMASTWLGSLGGAGPTISVLESKGHQDLIYAPVPEPETYALFMAGLAAVGFMTKRRKSRS